MTEHKVSDESAIDLSEFEHRLSLRPLTLEDFDALVAMQEASFPGMKPWTRAQVQSQLSLFPDGQICVEIDGQLAASSSSLILDYDANLAWHDWKAVADGGFIRTHNPKGDTLYGLEVVVAPAFRGMKLARRLYDARKSLCRERNLARIIVGGRIPGYGAHADAMSAREYVERVIDKTFVDPVLTVQIANGFTLRGLIPNYLPSDVESRGYATFCEWLNYDHQPGARRRFHHPVEPIRLAVVQYQMRAIRSFDEFVAQSEFFIDAASDYKSDFVLFPELFTTQLLSCLPKSRPGAAARQLHDFTPQFLEHFHAPRGHVQREHRRRFAFRRRG